MPGAIASSPLGSLHPNKASSEAMHGLHPSTQERQPISNQQKQLVVRNRRPSTNNPLDSFGHPSAQISEKSSSSGKVKTVRRMHTGKIAKHKAMTGYTPTQEELGRHSYSADVEAAAEFAEQVMRSNQWVGVYIVVALIAMVVAVIVLTLFYYM